MTLSDPKRRGLKIAAIATALIAVVGGTIAFAHTNGGHHGAHMTGGHSAQALEHVQSMLAKIGASDVQKAQIDGILKPALADMNAARDSHYAAFRQFHEVISAPSIDRVRLEDIRAAQLESLDEASKRLVTAISDAAEVLSPEQRAALAKEIENHHRG